MYTKKGTEMSERGKVVAILSYEAWRHPRAIKIARTLAKHGYKIKMWGARKPIHRGPRIIKALFNYIFTIIEVALLKADFYWVENVPDIIYIPLPILGRKYVYDRRSPWAKQVQLELGLKIANKLIEVIERFMIKHAQHIVVVSTSMKAEFNYQHPVTILPNYTEKSFIRPPTKDIRAELGIPATRKIFIYVGKLSKIEGTDLLIPIAKAIVGLNAELWIVGDGPARSIAEKLAKKFSNNVKWFGWVERAKIPDYILAADYGIVPRHKTPFSIFYSYEGVHKIGEYFAYGKPVIASGIAPSKYYLVVNPEKLPETIAKVAKGELEPPKLPRNFIWEKQCEHKVIEVIRLLENM